MEEGSIDPPSRRPRERLELPPISRAFVSGLHGWYAKHKRDLPWRKTTDPYKILVSEVMLQQTQVDRVIPKYEIFLESFPSVQDLAKASPARVIAIWSGLGYNRRALNLHKGAKAVVETMDGEYPRQPEELVKIPGIGPYTAAAVASFAFNIDAAVVDTNVIRVLTRVLLGSAGTKSKPSRETFDSIAKEILPAGNARIHNNAIMEFGALICQARPACSSCFAAECCAAYQEMKMGLLTSTELELLGTPKGGFGTIQSKFEGSDRQVRGAIIKALKSGRESTPTTLAASVAGSLNQKIAPKRFAGVLQKLERDGMIAIKDGKVALPTE